MGSVVSRGGRDAANRDSCDKADVWSEVEEYMILVILPLMAMAGLVSFTFALTLWVVKLFADSWLLMKSAAFADQRKLLWLFLPASVIYPFYQAGIGVISIFRPRYQWKNRNWK